MGSFEWGQIGKGTGGARTSEQEEAEQEGVEQEGMEQEEVEQEGAEQEGVEQEDTYIYTFKMCKLSKSLSHMHTNTHCSLKQCFHSCFLPHVHNSSLPIGRVGGGSHLVCSKLLPTTCKASNHYTHLVKSNTSQG